MQVNEREILRQSVLTHPEQWKKAIETYHTEARILASRIVQMLNPDGKWEFNFRTHEFEEVQVFRQDYQFLGYKTRQEAVEAAAEKCRKKLIVQLVENISPEATDVAPITSCLFKKDQISLKLNQLFEKIEKGSIRTAGEKAARKDEKQIALLNKEVENLESQKLKIEKERARIWEWIIQINYLGFGKILQCLNSKIVSDRSQNTIYASLYKFVEVVNKGDFILQRYGTVTLDSLNISESALEAYCDLFSDETGKMVNHLVFMLKELIKSEKRQTEMDKIEGEIGKIKSQINALQPNKVVLKEEKQVVPSNQEIEKLMAEKANIEKKLAQEWERFIGIQFSKFYSIKKYLNSKIEHDYYPSLETFENKTVHSLKKIVQEEVHATIYSALKKFAENEASNVNSLPLQEFIAHKASDDIYSLVENFAQKTAEIINASLNKHVENRVKNNIYTSLKNFIEVAEKGDLTLQRHGTKTLESININRSTFDNYRSLKEEEGKAVNRLVRALIPLISLQAELDEIKRKIGEIPS